jgi:hypothetical protein
MKKTLIIAISLAIIVGALIFENWINTQFPLVEYISGELPNLSLNSIREYDYSIEGDKAGTYKYWIESKGPYNGDSHLTSFKTVYFSRSLTSLVHDDTVVEIESSYIFGTQLTPYEYHLNASLGEISENITCIFEGWLVKGRKESEEGLVKQNLELQENAVLLDMFMLGHWDLFFKQFSIDLGKRVEINAYIPQTLSVHTLTLVSEKKTNVVSVGGINYDCQVVNVIELNLELYIYEGDIIMLKEPDKEIEIKMVNVEF